MRKASYDSTLQVFAVVDLQLGVPYALNVVIITPTSQSTANHPLPRDDYSKSFLSLTLPTVVVNGNTLVSWLLPRASDNDTICEGVIHCLSVLHDTICEGYTVCLCCMQSVCEGYTVCLCCMQSVCVMAPSSPGVYSVRYYPAWLAPHNSSCQHHSYILSTSLIVTQY